MDQYPIDNPVFYDLEVFPGWFEAGFKYQDNYYQYIVTQTDRSHVIPLLGFLDWASTYNCPLVGFNSNHYDDPVLSEFIHSGGDPDVAFRTSVDIIQNGVPSWTFSNRIQSIDLMPVLPGRMSLKKIGVCLGHHKLQELPIAYDKTPSPEEQLILCDYNKNDLDITQLLYEEVYSEIKLRRDASMKYGVDLRSKGRATMAELILLSQLAEHGDYRGKKELNKLAREIIYRYPFVDIFRPHWWDKLVSNNLPITEKVGTPMFSNKVPIDYGRLDGSYVNEKVFMNDRFFKMGVGGLHSIDSPGKWVPKEDEVLLDIDVSSYYPNLILTNQLYPRAWGEVFLTIFQNIVDERMAAKKSSKVIEKAMDLHKIGDIDGFMSLIKEVSQSSDLKIVDELKELYDLMTAVGKVVANGTYGKTSEEFSALYDPQVTVNTTVPGQLSLLALIEMLSPIATICSANTDGIMVLFKQEREDELKSLVGKWEHHTRLEMEYSYYKAFYQKDVNNYIAVKTNGKIKQKGFFLDKWPDLEHTPSGNIIATAVIKLLTENIPVVNTVTTCKDINQFLLTQNLSSGWSSSWNGQDMGRILRFYKSNSNRAAPIIKTPGPNNKGNTGVVSQSEGCVCVPDLPENFPEDVNYAWYIDQAMEMLNKVRRPKRVGLNKLAYDLYHEQGLALCLVDPDQKRISRAKVEFGAEDYSTIPEGKVLGVMTGGGIMAQRYTSGFVRLLRVDKPYPTKTRPLVERNHGFTLLYGGRVPLTGAIKVWQADEDLDQYYTAAELRKVRNG